MNVANMSQLLAMAETGSAFDCPGCSFRYKCARGSDGVPCPDVIFTILSTLFDTNLNEKGAQHANDNVG